LWQQWEGLSQIHRRPWLVEVGYTEEEAAKVVWQEQDRAKQIARKYELDALLLVSSCFQVTYSDWLRMPRSVRRGLVELAEEHNRRIESQRKERERELQQQLESYRGSLRLPHPVPSALPRIMGT
jgi:hypothetical protein